MGGAAAAVPEAGLARDDPQLERAGLLRASDIQGVLEGGLGIAPGIALDEQRPAQMVQLGRPDVLAACAGSIERCSDVIEAFVDSTGTAADVDQESEPERRLEPCPRLAMRGEALANLLQPVRRLSGCGERPAVQDEPRTDPIGESSCARDPRVRE